MVLLFCKILIIFDKKNGKLVRSTNIKTNFKKKKWDNLVNNGFSVGKNKIYLSTNGKLNIIDFSLDLNNRYTFWSGLTGGLFLALSYFGTDQSQVQRYLSGKTIKESQMGLIMNGIFF